MFRRVGLGLSILELPVSYAQWQEDRELHLRRDLACGEHTRALYAAYRQHLGPWRYHLLRQVQDVLVPEHVRALLGLPGKPWLRGLLPLYPTAARLGLRGAVRQVLIPPISPPSSNSISGFREDAPGEQRPRALPEAPSRFGASPSLDPLGPTSPQGSLSLTTQWR